MSNTISSSALDRCLTFSFREGVKDIADCPRKALFSRVNEVVVDSVYPIGVVRLMVPGESTSLRYRVSSEDIFQVLMSKANDRQSWIPSISRIVASILNYPPHFQYDMLIPESMSDRFEELCECQHESWQNILEHHNIIDVVPLEEAVIQYLDISDPLYRKVQEREPRFLRKYVIHHVGLDSQDLIDFSQKIEEIILKFVERLLVERLFTSQ